MKKLFFLLSIVLVSVFSHAQIRKIISEGNQGADRYQFETDDAVVYQIIKIVPDTTAPIDAGILEVKYLATNMATGGIGGRVRTVIWRRVNGTSSVSAKVSGPTGSTTNMAGVDFDAVVVNNEIFITIVGIAATRVRHTLVIEKFFSNISQQ